VLFDFPDGGVVESLIHGVGCEIEAVLPGDCAEFNANVGEALGIGENREDSCVWRGDERRHVDEARGPVEESDEEAVLGLNVDFRYVVGVVADDGRRYGRGKTSHTRDLAIIGFRNLS
jgi:hypothetical protein